MRRLRRELDEVRPLLRRLGEQDAVVRQNRDRVALDVREARHERLAVERLELVEARAVHDAGDHLACVGLMAEVLRDQSVELGRIGGRRFGLGLHPGRLGLASLQVADDLACQRECVLVGERVVVGDAGLPRVHVGTAEFLSSHVLPGRRLHEWRAADEDRAGAAHDDRLVRHGRHVGTAGGARSHHDGDLRNALRRHLRLVEEDAAEMVAVGKDLVLQGQKCAARVDQVEAREVVLLGHLLGPQVLLDGEWEIRAALDGRVVRDDHALPALDDADAGDDACRRGLALVEVPRSERVQFEERCAGIHQPVDPFPRGELPPRPVAFGRLLAAAHAISAVRSRNSATRPSMRRRRRLNSSDSRSTCEVRTAIALSLSRGGAAGHRQGVPEVQGLGS